MTSCRAPDASSDPFVDGSIEVKSNVSKYVWPETFATSKQII